MNDCKYTLIAAYYYLTVYHCCTTLLSRLMVIALLVKNVGLFDFNKNKYIVFLGSGAAKEPHAMDTQG